MPGAEIRKYVRSLAEQSCCLFGFAVRQDLPFGSIHFSADTPCEHRVGSLGDELAGFAEVLRSQHVAA